MSKIALHWIARLIAWGLVIFIFIAVTHVQAHDPASEGFFELVLAFFLLVGLVIYVG